ncbi:hypothetical protein FOC4_g10005713 [Fusarium odoratissimum]|uniref:Uncharacterized protein n=1 Tax=Fusarium oxysporum f. sp. cubense (strain race 4) TaxID=2502994 RepID=N1RZC8_FUSC4|nr:hypothetical protein FOC4_g10005713 [Fusarium odoratissimum]
MQDIFLRQGDPVDLLRAYLKACWQSLRTTWIWRFFTATYPCLPKSVPVFSKTDKVPCVSQLSQHRIILIYAFTPIIVQQVLMSLHISRTFNIVWDMVGAPVLAYTTLRYLNIPFDFFMLWICLHYIVYTGISSHSGLRILMFPLTLSPLLSYFNAELSIEDHDLYHRYCWRIAKNYGKQTRLWDRVFGTCSVRLESNASNIDYKNRIEVPFY